MEGLSDDLFLKNEIGYVNGVWEKAIHVSRCVAENVMINMGVVITIT